MERKYRKNKSENCIKEIYYDNFSSGINMTKKAVEDYHKLFNNSLSSNVTCEPKKNWHKQKYFNKQKELKKRIKNNYPYYLKEKRFFVNKKVHKEDNPIMIVSFEKIETLVDKYPHSIYASTCSLKNKNKEIYYQRKHSYNDYKRYRNRLSSYYENGWNTNVYEDNYTEVVRVSYRYKVGNKSNFFTFQTNKIIDNSVLPYQDEKYTYKQLVDLITLNLDSVISIDVAHISSVNDIFVLLDKMREGYSYSYNRCFSLYNEDNEFLKKHPNYKGVLKEIDKEINFYSGMRRQSNGKTKYNKIIKDIVHNYNSISSLENFDNYEIKKEILYNAGDFVVPYICDCEVCIKNFGEPTVIDNDLLINYECEENLLMLESLYTDILNDYEKWEYIW